MLTPPPAARRGRDWLLLVIAAGIVLATVPVARALTTALRERFGEAVFLYATLAGLGLGAAMSLRALRGTALRAQLWTAATALALAGYAFVLQGNAIETLHLLEYAAVGFLAFRALCHRTRDITVYGSAAMMGGILGALDEALQWLTPERVWDLRDIGFNAFAATLAQLPTAFGLRPAWISVRPTREGWHRFCAIGLAGAIFIGACLAATPPRLAWLGERVPGLGFLLRHPDVMLEYGHVHTLGNGTWFRSRLSASALRRTDSARAEEAGHVLRERGADEAYAEFLAAHTTIGDPFLHEIRVHLFRRDRYLLTAERHREPRPHQFRHDRAVALREQEILETYFPATMRAGGFDLEPEIRRALDAEDHATDPPYGSAVSRKLITAWPEPAVLAIPGAAGAAFTLGWILTRRGRRSG